MCAVTSPFARSATNEQPEPLLVRGNASTSAGPDPGFEMDDHECGRGRAPQVIACPRERHGGKALAADVARVAIYDGLTGAEAGVDRSRVVDMDEQGERAQDRRGRPLRLAKERPGAERCRGPHPTSKEATAAAARREHSRSQRRLPLGYSGFHDARPAVAKSGVDALRFKGGRTNKNL